METGPVIHWQGVYAAKADTAASWFQETPAPSLDLIGRLAPPPGPAILDVGGGASRLVDHLLARGYRDLSVLDLSATALDIAARRLGEKADGVTWIAADMIQWTPSRAYDLWHDRAALHFLTDPTDQCLYVERMRAGLKVGGHAILATFAPDGPERCSGLPVQRHDAASLSALLGPDFTLVETFPHNHVTPAGGFQTFQFSAFRRG